MIPSGNRRHFRGRRDESAPSIASDAQKSSTRPCRGAQSRVSRVVWWLFTLSFLAAAESPRPEEPAFRPGEVWLDTSGRPINAHGADPVHNGTYYWLRGEQGGPHLAPGIHQAWDGYRVDVTGIRCYSSTNLFHWHDEDWC